MEYDKTSPELNSNFIHFIFLSPSIVMVLDMPLSWRELHLAKVNFSFARWFALLRWRSSFGANSAFVCCIRRRIIFLLIFFLFSICSNVNCVSKLCNFVIVAVTIAHKPTRWVAGDVQRPTLLIASMQHWPIVKLASTAHESDLHPNWKQCELWRALINRTPAKCQPASTEPKHQQRNAAFSL